MTVDESENGTNAAVSENAFKSPVPAKVGNKKRKRQTINETDRRSEEAYQFLQDMRNKPEDECSLFSDLLCQKLRMLNEELRPIAMHEIDCLMFRFKRQQCNLPTPPYFQEQLPLHSPAHSNSYSQPSPGYSNSSSSHSQPSPYFHFNPSPVYQPSQPSPRHSPSPSSHYHPSPVCQPPQSSPVCQPPQSSPGFQSSSHTQSQPSIEF